MKLPFKEGNDLLPDNYMLTLNRLKSLLKRLRGDPELLKEYDAIMKEQCKLGILEDVDPNTPGTVGRIHYLPHHPVIRTDKSTSKVRIGYDASSKATRESLSLNNALYPGPSLIPLILDILIRFRCHKIALTSDIEKAFLMVGVAPEDHDVLRLLWIDDILTDNLTLLIKRFTRVIFGVSSSPILLSGTVSHHIEKYEQEDPDFVAQVLHSLYVDVTGFLEITHYQKPSNFTFWRKEDLQKQDII